MSLSSWFKDYVYIPLGGNRKGVLRLIRNIFIVWFLTGFWHGASWNFVFWGLWHGIFIIIEKATNWHKKEGRIGLNIIKHIYTILVFVVGWVMFRAENMTYAWIYIKNMFGCLENVKNAYELPYYIGNLEILVAIISCVCAVPVFSKILQIDFSHKVLRSLVNIWLMILFVISASAIASSTYNPFIYFRF